MLPLGNVFIHKIFIFLGVDSITVDSEADERISVVSDCSQRSNNSTELCENDRREYLDQAAEDSDDCGDSEDSDDSDNPEDPEDPPNPQYQPLYEGARITVAESLLSILALVLRFSVTGVLLANILTLIEMHCPEQNYCTSSLYMFKKYFEEIHTPLNRHFYCGVCLHRLANEREQCPNCLNLTDCKYFMTFSISEQLRALYKRRGFYQKLMHRFNRNKIVQENIEDIYDAEIYQELSSPGNVLHDRNNISFTWYTDGIPIFKSSKFSIWPVYFVINELPYQERFKKENIILVGLWFGDEKPEPNMYLLPIYNEVIELRNGIEIETPDIQNPINVKAWIICGTCDLPAKALFLNMKQYNGKFGCHKCKQPGERLEKRQVYPYKKNMNLRTEAETLRQADRVTTHPICGVKGQSIISFLAYKWITTTTLDPMHCIFSGVMKMMLKLWFDKKFSKENFSVSGMVDLIDEKIKNLLSPEFVQRRPRSIKEHLKFWKASELKNFFFYFSIPLLKDILEQEYFDHFKLLVIGISLLCQPSISEQMIRDSSRALHEFVRRFEHLYGRKFMSCNVHSLLHLPEIVRKMGPLWTFSCFDFEDINGKLKNLVHGSKNAQLQVYFGASLFINTFTLNKELLVPGTPPHSFCKKLLSATKQMKLQVIDHLVYIVGTLSKFPIPQNIRQVILNHGIRGENVIPFKKLMKNNLVYSSESYTRSKLTDSTYVKYTLLGMACFGRIKFFIRVANCRCKKICQCPNINHYAVITRCTSEIAFPNFIIPRVRINSIHKIKNLPDDYKIIDIRLLQTVCFSIKNNEIMYLADPVNVLERE